MSSSTFSVVMLRVEGRNHLGQCLGEGSEEGTLQSTPYQPLLHCKLPGDRINTQLYKYYGTSNCTVVQRVALIQSAAPCINQMTWCEGIYCTEAILTEPIVWALVDAAAFGWLLTEWPHNTIIPTVTVGGLQWHFCFIDILCIQITPPFVACIPIYIVVVQFCQILQSVPAN